MGVSCFLEFAIINYSLLTFFLPPAAYFPAPFFVFLDNVLPW